MVVRGAAELARSVVARVNDEEDGVRGGRKRFALLMVAELVIAERERSCWTREEDGFAVLVLLLRFPWLLREEEELAVAQGAKMVVAQIPAKCCRFVAASIYGGDCGN